MPPSSTSPNATQAQRMQLVKESLTLITPRAERVAAVFYERLLDRHPPVRHLFAHTDFVRQGRSLMWMIVWAVQQLDHPDELISRLKELGRRHEGYGVRAEHYDMVGGCLLDALQTELGEAFTHDLRLAWAEVYVLMSQAMMSAAEKASEPA